jgi:transcriptional regulator with XRE-family HTH domain
MAQVSEMRKPAAILREIMQRRGQTNVDLARAVGISPRTLVNIISGNNSSRISRQKITDLCGEQIWPDVTISGHLIRVPCNTSIEFETAEQALKFAQAFGPNVTVGGRSVVFVLPTYFAVELPMDIRSKTKRTEPLPSAHETPQQGAKNRKLSASSSE